jgi:hypothetical protein
MTAMAAYRLLVARYPRHAAVLSTQEAQDEYLLELTAIPEGKRKSLVESILAAHVSVPPNPEAFAAARRGENLASPTSHECVNSKCCNGWVPISDERMAPLGPCRDCGIHVR